MPDAREPAVPTAPSGGPRSGPTALVGLEIELPASPWPPRIEGARWDDHGLVDTGDDRRRVLEELSASQPARVVVVCSLTTTPDRGHRSFLDELTRAAGAPVCVVLTGGDALRRRRDGGQVGARVEDWRHLARSAGIGSDRVLEVDLDHLTDVTESELSKLVGTATVGPAAVRRIEPAFDLVVEHLDRWPAVPEPKAQAELHRQIASLYRQEQESWRAFLGAPAELGGDVTAALRAGADRVVQLLPARLRMRPAWVASGAVAGALGCVAAATLLAPVAITALPVWSALGAVVGAVTGASTARDDDRQGAGQTDADLGRADAVRAAALLALLLELQGHPEATITRILDRVIDGEDEGPGPATTEEARRWLAGVRHRLDLALAGEVAS